jgi:ornithine carbamoyltransferase
MKRDLVSFSLWEKSELLAILELAAAIKKDPPGRHRPLEGRTAAMIFE